jgi:hypothetical protein
MLDTRIIKIIKIVPVTRTTTTEMSIESNKVIN